ncbi:helix-turn-helix domain-containing protein [Kitasatospora hibisci]|uniref:helix-turn-helix domain-containing protein n=1 Tax=Kitasatospora hibisci TaxID=3369522 RepID=UPI0037542CED
MGRRENPIGAQSESLRALANWLRCQRESAKLSYEKLATLTSYGDDTLRRAASGKKIPRLAVVQEFAKACGSDTSEAERLWKLARSENVISPAKKQLPAVHISYVESFSDLHAALVDLHRRDGCRSYRELAIRAGGYGRLSISTLSRVFNRQNPPSREFVVAFARTCGVRGPTLKSWEMAWERANAELHPGKARLSVSQRRSMRSSIRSELKGRKNPDYDAYSVTEHGEPASVACAGCRNPLADLDPKAVSSDSEFWCSRCFGQRMKQFKDLTDRIRLRRGWYGEIFELLRCDPPAD